MRQFSQLLDSLVYTRSRNGKLALIAAYMREAPDPDRGWALAALTGNLDLKAVKASAIGEMIRARTDPVLFEMSRDYVGDLAETVALLWPRSSNEPAELDDGSLSLSAIIDRLHNISRAAAPDALAQMMDHLDASGRFALLKLATGGLRVGISARLAKTGFAQAFGLDVDDVEQVWHALAPPYTALFDWAEGRSARPDPEGTPYFRPFMLAHPLEADSVDLADYAAEWKWDGIRVQLSRVGATRKLYSRSGDDISGAFPDVLDAIDFEGVMDGELLIGGTARSNNLTRTFSDLQQRLNRKTVTAKMLDDYPAFIRAYDLLFEGESDIRAQTYLERRGRLSDIIEHAPHDRFDLSPLIGFSSWQELDTLRAAPPDPVIEGVMIKRRDSAYQAGRAKGPWFKWKRDPYNIDAVMMYAQRGHGKRSSYYSDFTFGVWAEGEDGEQLVPVGKAYFGFTDAELEVLDKFVRDNTVERFGPVRAVRATPDFGFVLEVAFEGINRSTRHKSGVAMRFPRIARLRADKLPAEADRLSTLVAMIDGVEG